jgi:hypothetical protein
MEIPAGWYPDPAGDTTRIRYWNGQAWTEQTQPAINPELQAGAGGFGPVPDAAAQQGQQFQQPLQAPQANVPLQPIYAPGQELPAYPVAPQGTDRKGLAIASLVLGIVGVLSCCLSWVATIPGILAIIFGILGVKSSKKGMAIAGIICGALAIILGILMLVFALDMIKNPTEYGLPRDYFDSFGI